MTVSTRTWRVRSDVAIAAALLALCGAGTAVKLAAHDVVGTAAQAKQSEAVGQLIRRHDCVRMGQPVTPIAGYLIRDTANPGRLFYRDAGSLTSGLFVGWGGTWEMRYQCRR